MKNITTKVISGLAFISMVVVNVLANSLPINNRSTGAISDAYPNIFAPAGPAFSIWGLIYLLLSAYLIYQFTKKDQKTESLLQKINPLFVATSLANISWILAWHYDYIGYSLVIMISLLLLLIKIADILRAEHFTFLKKIFIYTPFSLYFGWITVATIANIVVFLVSIDWDGFGVPDFVWASVVLAIGATIGIIRMLKDRNIIYGLVFIWAYFWILFKHISVGGFNGQYPAVIAIAITCLVALILFVGKMVCKK